VSVRSPCFDAVAFTDHNQRVDRYRVDDRSLSARACRWPGSRAAPFAFPTAYPSDTPAACLIQKLELMPSDGIGGHLDCQELFHVPVRFLTIHGQHTYCTDGKYPRSA